MSSQTPVTIPGVILPDGTLELSQPHGLGPGPVQVSVAPISAENGEQATTIPSHVPVPLPDPPIIDTAISAPCSLPLTGPFKRIYPRKLDKMPLPDPHDIGESME